MLHKFLEPGDWFAPKRYGYGSGLPIAWQGWALIAAYVLAMAGIAVSLERLSAARQLAAVGGMLALTALFLVVVARRTRGGWRWRRGERD